MASVIKSEETVNSPEGSDVSINITDDNNTEPRLLLYEGHGREMRGCESHGCEDESCGAPVKHPAYSIVWTPICGITWFFPCIGHMGITDDEGMVYEFMGFGASKGKQLSFGPVVRYVTFPESARTNWASGISTGCRMSEGRSHKALVDNCHTFVADSLNDMRIKGFRFWNSILLALMVFFCGKYTSKRAFFYHVIPTFLILSLTSSYLDS